MSAQDSMQARRSLPRRDSSVAPRPASCRPAGTEPACFGMQGMPVDEWRRWRQRIRRLLAHPLPLVQRGFLEGQLFRLGSHPVDAEEAEPPCESAVKRIEELEERIPKRKITRRRRR